MWLFGTCLKTFSGLYGPCKGLVLSCFPSRTAYHSRQRPLIASGHPGGIRGGGLLSGAHGMPCPGPSLILGTRRTFNLGFCVLLSAAARVLADLIDCCFIFCSEILFLIVNVYCFNIFMSCVFLKKECCVGYVPVSHLPALILRNSRSVCGSQHPL